MNDETRERLIKIESDRLAMRALDIRANIEASRRRLLLGADK